MTSFGITTDAFAFFSQHTAYWTAGRQGPEGRAREAAEAQGSQVSASEPRKKIRGMTGGSALLWICSYSIVDSLSLQPPFFDDTFLFHFQVKGTGCLGRLASCTVQQALHHQQISKNTSTLLLLRL